MKKYSIGIDPDLHTLSAALVSAEKGKANLEGVWTAKAKGTANETAVRDIIITMFDFLGIGALRQQAVDGSLGGHPLISIESQNVSYAGRTNAAVPQDLIYVAQVAGGCLGFFGYGEIFPPSVWKKQMPKKIVQARCFSALGLEYSVMGGSVQKRQYCVPKDFKRFDRTGNLNPGDWKDAGDSVALAYWRLKKEGEVK